MTLTPAQLEICIRALGLAIRDAELLIAPGVGEQMVEGARQEIREYQQVRQAMIGAVKPQHAVKGKP